jgi:hypothetical protein
VPRVRLVGLVVAVVVRRKRLRQQVAVVAAVRVAEAVARLRNM